jgi:DNA mismatch repair ATPase MutS
MEHEVVRIVTPGTLTDETLLEERRDIMLASVFGQAGRFGLARLDLSAGVSAWRAVGQIDDYRLVQQIRKQNTLSCAIVFYAKTSFVAENTCGKASPPRSMPLFFSIVSAT